MACTFVSDIKRDEFVDRPPRRDEFADRPPPRRDDYAPRPFRRDDFADRPPRRDHNEKAPPSEVLGVFGLSVQTRESDLDYEFSRFGTVESVNIVYDQRVSSFRKLTATSFELSSFVRL